MKMKATCPSCSAEIEFETGGAPIFLGCQACGSSEMMLDKRALLVCVQCGLTESVKAGKPFYTRHKKPQTGCYAPVWKVEFPAREKSLKARVEIDGKEEEPKQDVVDERRAKIRAALEKKRGEE